MRLKNNRMVTFRGDRTGKAMDDLCGISQGTWGRYESIKEVPIKLDRKSQKRCYVCADGLMPSQVVCTEHREFKAEAESYLPAQWGAIPLRIAKACGKEPEWFWPECIIAVKRSETVALQMSEIEVKQIAGPDEQLYLNQRSEKITDVLKTLPKRERRILEMSFGLNGRECLTLEGIAKKEGVSRERVRQIINKSVRLLRHPSRTSMLREVLPTHAEDRVERQLKREEGRREQARIKAQQDEEWRAQRLAEYTEKKAKEAALAAQEEERVACYRHELIERAEKHGEAEVASKLKNAMELQDMFRIRFPDDPAPSLQSIYETMED
jgi:RNA polymerase sigma factor (sigma-70 family)